MDGVSSNAVEGSLLISSDAIEKIARHATLEVEGVADVRTLGSATGSLMGVISASKPIMVEINNDVADVEVSIVVYYGVSIPEVSEEVQKNVKSSIQNMTTITVGRVNVTVVGILPGGEE
ncbi:Asp23/Gls24 family envelope stress response protein [Ruminococcaceae bacterium OttesenSCG-928-I18]|nr:Asp23/Gls24 family envelope stress response protein [Ruminococcaceae bacterium OttesenSCG-928-I18]